MLALCHSVSAQQDPVEDPAVEAMAVESRAVVQAIYREDPDARAQLDRVVERFDALTKVQRLALARTTTHFNLGYCLRRLGDEPNSKRITEQFVADRTRIYGEDSMEAAQARAQMCFHHATFGDQEDALARLRISSRELAKFGDGVTKDRFDVDRLIAQILYDKKDFVAAAEVTASVLERSRRQGPYPENSALTQDLVSHALAVYRLGQIEAARDLFEERLTLEESVHPPEHPSVIQAMQQLSAVRGWLQDHPGAISLMRKVYEARKRTLAANDPQLIASMAGLGSALSNGGEKVEALELLQGAVDAYAGIFADEHPDVLQAKQNLAVTLNKFDRHEEAAELMAEVIAIREGNTPETSRYLQHLFMVYAETLKACGRFDEAVKYGRRALRGIQKILPEDHELVQGARMILGKTYELSGDWEEAAKLGIEHCRVTRRTLTNTGLALRPAMERASAQIDSMDFILSLVRSREKRGTPLAEQRDCLEAALLTGETLRGVALGIARRSLRARKLHGQSGTELERQLTAATAALERARRFAVDPLDIERAVRNKERIERLILLRSESQAAPQPDVAALAQALPERSVAVSIAVHKKRTIDPDLPGLPRIRYVITALVLHPSGRIDAVDLGDLNALDALETEGPAARKTIRRHLVDPILAAAGDIDTLFLSRDMAIEMQPFDGLPLDNGNPLGNKIRIHRVETLFELVRSDAMDPSEEPELLALGGIDYAAEPGRSAIDQPEELALDAETLRSGARPEGFAPLEGSRAEALLISDQFREHFGDPATLLTGTGATEYDFAQNAPGKTFIHIATHGYYAGSEEEWTASLAPFVLCGLALTGANIGADAGGHDPGVVSAAEIQCLDLSACYLAVLSACDSAQGVPRHGLSAASLHTAFHGAGARFVVSSLWKVSDLQTQHLMAEFYANLWDRGMDPHDALWAAKEATRRRGAPFRDWAGWILTGR